MQKRLSIFVAALVLALAVMNQIFYVVNERQLAVVTQFQRLITTQETAGLKIKLPLLHQVEYFDARLQRLDVEPEMFMTNEKKWLLVDYFVEWRIKELRTFYTSVQGSLERAGTLLDQLVKESLRGEFVKYNVKEALAGGRASIMDNVTEQLSEDALRRYGVEIVGVRLKRIDFSDDIRDHVFERMRAERERVSKSLRAQGEEKSQIIRANAERQAAETLAAAQEEALILRGIADAEAARLYAEVYGQDMDFYQFWRSMLAYQSSLVGKNNTMILEPNTPFFQYLRAQEALPSLP